MEKKKSVAISIANIIIEIGQQHQECWMVILKKRNKIRYPQIFSQEGHLKSGTFGINLGHRDILSKNGTVPGKTGRMGTLIYSASNRNEYQESSWG
jgi:hypothetical protein